MQPRAFERPLVESRAEDGEQAFDPDSFDFTTYLSRRLGFDRDLTAEVLGYWLTHYEPVASAPVTTESMAPGGRRPETRRCVSPSGIFSVPSSDSLPLTGTDS
jgi:hypothetical protein